MHMQMQAHQMQLSGGPERSGRRGSCSWPGPGHRRRIGSDRIGSQRSHQTKLINAWGDEVYIKRNLHDRKVAEISRAI
jgi:hypothetical protein